MFYDAKFGRKRTPEFPNGQSTDPPNASNARSSSGVTPNGSAHVNTSDLAIYEQFRSQVLLLIRLIGDDVAFTELDFLFMLCCYRG